MTPLLTGVFASQISGRLTAPDSGAMFPIATVNVGSSGATFVEFTNIPQTYKHLQIRASIRGATADTAGQSWIRFNNVTTNNYVWHGAYGTGGAQPATENSMFSSKDAIYSAFRHPSNTAPAGLFGIGICDILDYTSTTKFKVTRSFSGYDANGSGQSRLYSGYMNSNTNAITSIRIQDQSGGGYTQFTKFELYGIKG